MRLTAKKSGISQEKTEKVVNAFLYSINHSLLAGKKVEVRYWATLTPVLRKARQARNVHTNEKIMMPPTWRIRFKESKIVRQFLNKGGK